MMQLKHDHDRYILNVLYNKLIAYNDMHGFPAEGSTERGYFARMVANTIHDLNPIQTGFVSKAAIDAVNNQQVTVSSLCHEHFKSRQKCGGQVLSMFEREIPTFNRLVDFIMPMCLVHRTLSKENDLLTEHQQKHDSWVDAYRAAGVQLVDVGTCNMLRAERLYKHKDSEPTELQHVDQIIHDLSRYS